MEVPEGQNDLRRMQLRELAQLNGTLRENDAVRCANCSATDHKTWLVSTHTCVIVVIHAVQHQLSTTDIINWYRWDCVLAVSR